jgi:D-alanyl-D-alanine carboxypeptidase
MRRALVVAAIVAGQVCAASALAPAASAAEPPEGVDEPQAWIVVDASSGRVLAAREPHAALPPASLAKVMTALVAVERLPAGAEVAISELAASQPRSKLGALAGEQYRFEDAVAALMMESSNDMAYALAEATGGDLEGFDELLDATAERYGMRDSELNDPAGFDDETAYGGGPRMSPFDVAVSVRNALAVPGIAKWAAAPTYTFDGPAARFELVNHNRMLPGASLETAGVNGFKTGRTNLAGNTLAATATREGRTMIVVVMNTPDVYAWATYLLDVGFETAAGDGTGEQVPEPEVSIRAQRERDRDEFLALVTGQAGTGATTTVATVAVEPFEPPATTAAGAGANDENGQDDAGGSGGGFPLGTIAIAGTAGLGVVFVARREQVKRRKRQRRIGRERADMMRRGSLPVVDGRYRTGMRVGPPVQSHVRLHRPEDDTPE